MENGVGNPDDGKLVQGEDLEQKVVGLGLHRQKESEGDDVFEEAVGAVITDIDSEGRVVILENNGGEAGDLGKGDEPEMFEEAIGATGEGLEETNEEKKSGEDAKVLVTEESLVNPFEVLNQEDVSDEKAEVLVTEKELSIGEETEKVEVSVTEESSVSITNEETESGEKEELMVTPREIVNGVREESGEEGKLLVTEEESQIASEPEEVVSIVSEEVKQNHGIIENGEDTTENPTLKDEVNEMSSEVTKKPLNGVVHMIEEKEDIDIDKQGKEVHGLLEIQDANEVKGGHTDSGQEVESNGHSLDQEVNEIYGTPMAKEHENDEHKGDVINLIDEEKTPQHENTELKGDVINPIDEEKTPEHENDELKGDVIHLKDEEKTPEETKSLQPENQGNQDKDVPSIDETETSSITLDAPKLEEELPPVAKEAVINQPEKKDEEEAKPSIEVKPTMTHSSPPVQSAPVPTQLPARPAGLGRTASLLEPAPRVIQQPRVNGALSAAQNQILDEPPNGETEENDETREKLQMIRVKFLRLAHRLGQTPHNVVVAQVLYRLGLAEQLRGRTGGRVAAFSFDRASAMAEQLESAGQEPLDFSCTIMVLGKTGVGKSATINSIFDEAKLSTDAFQCGTKKVQDVVGTVQGIKVRVIDTPGLLPSWSDQRQNEKTLQSVKRFITKTPPDIVLYLDRLDMQSRDLGDMPLLRTITEVFGPSIWFNAIVVLTHAASAPPEGPNGTATSYDMFVTQRSHAVQQAIRQAAGDMRLMNPVSLVENHSACRTNRAGQRVLPNGQVWKPHLLLLSFASKILAEANSLLKLQDNPPGRTFANRTRAPPLAFFLSCLLQSRPQVKLPTDHYDDDSTDLDDSSDSEDEGEYEYDQLPPFRSLTKAQLGELSKDQRKAYYSELEYREKLLMKKQLKEEKKQRKMFKKMQAEYKTENVQEEGSSAGTVPVPMPDLALPSSFDSDNPTHRYRSLDLTHQWLVRPVLDPNGWDHDVGYEGINGERLFVIKDKVPVSFSGQVSKDKKDTQLQMEVASSIKHGAGKATSLSLDMQSMGKDYTYTLRGESKFMNYQRNKMTGGVSVSVLGDTLSGGVKLEDKLVFNKRGQVVVAGGAMYSRGGDVAYGGSLEATLRDKDHPLGRFLSTLGVSVMDWHGDLSIGGNSQTQIPVGRSTNLIGRVTLNNKGSGQVSVRLNSSDQLSIALIALLPIARKLLGSLDYLDKMNM